MEPTSASNKKEGNPPDPCAPQSGDRAEPIADTIAYDCEAKRIKDHREAVGTQATQERPRKHWGLALSGGGIRSATFALGVLQGLASTTRERDGVRQPLLKYFDYLSTVSGGGYVGSFFCSLFVPGRLNPATAGKPVQAANEAYEALTYDPPGRAQHAVAPGAGVAATHGSRALAWLRNNGRYLAPTGAGDMFYASALAIRNWLSLQFVIGTLLLTAFALIATLRVTAVSFSPLLAELEWALLASSLQTGPSAWPIWWSPLWLLPVLIWALWSFPVGLAYWLSHPLRGETAGAKPHKITGAAVTALTAALFFLGLGGYALSVPDTAAAGVVLVVTSFATLLSLVFHVFVRGETVNLRRIALTRMFSSSLQVLGAFSAVALADTAGQTAYRVIMASSSMATHLVTPGALLAAVIWIIRKLAKFFDGKESKDSWFARVPVSWIAAVAGALMLLVIILFWELLVQWVRWNGLAPDPEQLIDRVGAVATLILFCLAFTLAVVIGRFPGFINQSSLQWLYGSRLTRAYLGGSNGERFRDAVNAERLASAAEPHWNDDIPHDRYYDAANCGPVHLINITVNQTTDSAEQLVQRDRKGLPMAVLPHGFSIDGNHFAFAKPQNPWEYQMPMRIGQWIGTSGAAFTTGLGRATSLGTSIALGLANVRLGSWWQSGSGQDPDRIGVDRFMRTIFKSQTYLGYEFTAQFHGLRRNWQYLSDGGHFENTGAYELLREGRAVELIVVCDDGADPLYLFDDLANLVRLARIDHRVEIELDKRVTDEPHLEHIFGTPEQFRSRTPNSQKCALLLTATPVDENGVRRPPTVIVVLKPVIVANGPVDVEQYAKTHPAFPQEPTSDQFFDEAQWESYRKLGRTIAARVFEQNGQHLADYLLDRYKIGV
jgi:hypothetical protein